MKLVLSEMWNNAFNDKHSEDFQVLERTIKKNVEDLYRDKNAQHNTIMTNLVDVTQ